jgi:hypothetical protein
MKAVRSVNHRGLPVIVVSQSMFRHGFWGIAELELELELIQALSANARRKARTDGVNAKKTPSLYLGRASG